MNTKRRELGMTPLDDQDGDDSADALEPIEGGEEEGEAAMQHACAACGETNTILPPRGHKFVRKSQVEREFDRLDEAFRSDIAIAFRESYAAKLRRRSCPLPT